MTKSEIKEFTAWTKTVSMSRIKIEDVPEQYKEAVEIYQDHRNNDSNDCVSYFCHHNAMCVVYSFLKKNQPKINDCGKCDGTGYIRAYAHIENGICFACEGKK